MTANFCALGAVESDSAGGIGGLLATSDPNDPNDPNDLFGDFVFVYDANGNVGQLIDLAAQGGGTAITAHYEYDPYGNVIVQSGAYAAANPYRFSTKPWDDETGLGYWGYRYYDPRLGRWISVGQLIDLAAPKDRQRPANAAGV